MEMSAFEGLVERAEYYDRQVWVGESNEFIELEVIEIIEI
jgi:hypothetical protein